jgi:hypothetical protein
MAPTGPPPPPPPSLGMVVSWRGIVRSNNRGHKDRDSIFSTAGATDNMSELLAEVNGKIKGELTGIVKGTPCLH